jgi:hypothetical protein
MRSPIWALCALLLGAWSTDVSTAAACGGFFCNGGGGPPPVNQAAERVIFEQRSDGSVRAYVQIRYDGGAPVGFSWIIPVQALPEVGIADANTFQELDTATAPQFQFINNAVPTFTDSGGGGCGGDALAAPAFDRAGAEPPMDSGVTVWETSRVGNYETATISGETAEDLLRWLDDNGYDVPDAAMDIIQRYVDEEHLFVAFRYDPVGVGTGTLDPVVLTMAAPNFCLPLRITAIASTPILDVMVLVFGAERAKPDPTTYLSTEPNYAAVRPDFTMPGGTTYGEEVAVAVSLAGGRAFVTEFAGPTSQVQNLTDLEALALTSRNAYVTRFYTRMTPEAMLFDPEFVFTGGPDVPRVHVVDITPRAASAGEPGAGKTSGGLRYAAVPFTFAGLGLWLLLCRRR